MIVEDRIYSWGLMAGIFTLLLAFSTSHGGWWRSRTSAAGAQSYKESVASAGASASNPFAATSEYMPTPTDDAPPAAATVNPGRAIALPEPEQNEPQREDDSANDVDYEAQAQQRNRGVEHGSRTR
jgi:hypothetical protein